MQTSTVSAPEARSFDSITGTHVIADLYGCPDSVAMTDAGFLERVCVDFVREAGLLDVGRMFHAFPGEGGVTGTVILAESHLCLHTWPEHGYVSLDVFVCNYSSDNSEKARNVADRLIELFGAVEARVKEISR